MLATAGLIAIAAGASAKEYFVGGPVQQHDMEIVANYLVGIEMAPMTADMAHGADVIHLEADVHATADNVYGYPDGAWVPYLTIGYTLEKIGTDWQTDGHVAADDRQGRAAPRRECGDGGTGRVQADLPVRVPRDAGFPAACRPRNRRAGVVEAVQRGVHLQVPAAVTRA